MLMIGAIIAFLEAAYILFFALVVGSMAFWLFGGLAFVLILCGVLPLLAGLFGIVGAMSSFKRERWTIALIGAILLIPGYSLVFGILALVFLILGKEEFTS